MKIPKKETDSLFPTIKSKCERRTEGTRNGYKFPRAMIN